MLARRREHCPAKLKQSVTTQPQSAFGAQTKHRAAKRDGEVQRSPFDVFNNPGDAAVFKPLANCANKIRMMLSKAHALANATKCLTRRTGMDRVEAFQWERQCVRLNELKRILRLWNNIDTDNIEASKVIAHSSAAGTTEQIK